ncbi:MAG: DUF4229 domain-containing protein [Rhodococcus sp. (in: high G+C Gram-positive bacteria)]|uniref:DUF4229 domain-containing protein n=1 Tax=Rhodococcus sp. TaxID=1831 RepID=UPI003BB1D419
MSESSKKPEAPKMETSNVEKGGVPPRRVTKGQLARDVAIYSVARLLLVVLIGAIILGVATLVGVEVPLLVAAIFAVLIALPLSLVLFGRLRRRVNAGIAAFDAQRREDQAQLRARLRGEDTSR